MRWSWKLGRIFGIDVFVHATFLLLIAWLVFSNFLEDGNFVAALAGAGFTIALFVCVVLHEFGHALTARRFGIQTQDITVLPIGGLARLERMPDEPKQELLVALAGPAVNVAIAIALYAILRVAGVYEPLSVATLQSGPFLERLMASNLLLVAFNLLPAFPMDGGRVLRALLAGKLPYARATRAAATMGQMMALLFGIVGVIGNPILLLIAVFVWVGAAQEARLAEMRHAFTGTRVGEAMTTEFHILHPQDSLATATRVLLATAQQDFPVISEGMLVGILTRQQLVETLAMAGENANVEQAMTRQFATLRATDSLESALTMLHQSELPTVPVFERNHLVGLMTMKNIGEFLMLQNARRARLAA